MIQSGAVELRTVPEKYERLCSSCQTHRRTMYQLKIGLKILTLCPYCLTNLVTVLDRYDENSRGY